MLGCVSANTANATALPAQFRAGQQVMNNAGGDHSQAAIMDFARGRAFHYGLLELSLLVKLTFAFLHIQHI